MFGSIVMVVVTVMHIYVFWRATSVPLVRQDIQRKYLIVLGLALWALFILGRVVGSEETGTFAGTLELWGMGWMATLFLM